MLYQEYDPYLDDKWLNDDYQLTFYIRARNNVMGSVKVEETPF